MLKNKTSILGTAVGKKATKRTCVMLQVKLHFQLFLHSQSLKCRAELFQVWLKCCVKLTFTNNKVGCIRRLLSLPGCNIIISVKVFSLQDVIKRERQSDYNRLGQVFSKKSVYTSLSCLEEGASSFLGNTCLHVYLFCMEIQNLKLFWSIRSLLFWACLLFCSYSTNSLIWRKKAHFWQPADLVSIYILLLKWSGINCCQQWFRSGNRSAWKLTW